MSSFARYIGVDYSGAETPTTSLKGESVPFPQVPRSGEPQAAVEAEMLEADAGGELACLKKVGELFDDG